MLCTRVDKWLKSSRLCFSSAAIGGGLQNILDPKKIVAAVANWEAKATGGGNQNILRAKKSAGGGRQWLSHLKKVGLSAECYFAAGRHYQLCSVQNLYSIVNKHLESSTLHPRYLNELHVS